MNKKVSLGVCVALMAIVATITLSITYAVTMERFNGMVHNVFERQQMYAKLAEVDQKVRQNYLGNIDETKLNDALAAGFMDGSGDRYGSYLSAEQYKTTASELEGQTIGIGITIRENADGSIPIIAVNQGSPAAEAGLQVGDVVTSIDEKPVGQMTFNEVYEAMQGDSGTKIKLAVRREDGDKSFEVTRKPYRIVSVVYRVIKGNVGYIKILEFNDNTQAQFTEAVRELQNKDVVGIVFDVRDNPGGTLPSVAGSLDLLLPAGNIVSSTDKDGKETVLYTSDSRQLDLPLSVIMNSSTASAAELFAAALKDYKKATLVGTTTRGKGTMQKIFPLTDGSALNITVAKFNPPSGNNFHEVGLIPDVESTLTEEQMYDFHLLSEDNDPQLLAAVNALALTGADPGAIGQNPADETKSDSSETSDEEVSGVSSSTSETSSVSETPSNASSASSGNATSPVAFNLEERLFRFL